jgi:biotin carboxyl carrier protein
MKYITTVDETSLTIDVISQASITINGEPRTLDLRKIDDNGMYSLLINNKSYEALVELVDGEYRVLIDGVVYPVQVMDERAKRLAEAAGGAFAATGGEAQIKSPMPGLIVAIPVKEGDTVKKGQVLIVLESMKMENELKSPRDGTVTGVRVQPRQAVEQGQTLIAVS